MCIRDRWFIGEEAKRLALLQGEEAVSGLLQAALAGKEFFIEGETYKAQELLALYIKKLVYLAGKLGNPVIPDFLVITLEQLSREVTELFLQVAERIGIPEGKLTLIDRRESFYYFAFSQQKELWLHDVCLFDNRGDEVWCRRLERDQRTMPQLVTISEEQRNIDRANKDEMCIRDRCRSPYFYIHFRPLRILQTLEESTRSYIVPVHLHCLLNYALPESQHC